MTALIEIHWTAGSLDEARRICRYLVQERYVACAQITPWIESIYMWDNNMETTQESRIVMKTAADLFEPVKAIILENHSYEVPEITTHPIEGGNQEYLDWVTDSVSLKMGQRIDG